MIIKPIPDKVNSRLPGERFAGPSGNIILSKRRSTLTFIGNPSLGEALLLPVLTEWVLHVGKSVSARRLMRNGRKIVTIRLSYWGTKSSWESVAEGGLP